MSKPLKMPDQHHVRAALGWFELGNPKEANEELEKISAPNRSHPDVLEIRWVLYARELRWDACRNIAKSIVEQDPSRPWGWIRLAYATRRAESEPTGLEKAQAILLKAIERFPKFATIPYNLACYACCLGNLKDAKQWLEHAFKIGDAQQLKLMALDDPDLEGLWGILRKS